MLGKRIPRKHLVLGTLFVVFGGTLLLRTSGKLSGVLPFWPVVLVVMGLYLLYRVYVLGGAESLVFYGIFSVQAGAFLLLLNAELMGNLYFRNLWPFFMLFAGVALLIYGLQRKGTYRVRYLIPAVSIILLSGIFLLFSLGFIRVSLKAVLVQFWPLILVLCGVFLILFDFFRNKIRSKKAEDV
ncbi:MAG: hypothetical protein N2442_01180 [Spirochaetes bacterium]|nr:hypothetical protein [Spirochaetota bacterium]